MGVVLFTSSSSDSMIHRFKAFSVVLMAIMIIGGLVL